MNRYSPYAAFLLRLAVGGVFLHHGWMKVTQMGLGGVATFFHSVGLPFATLGAAVVMTVETVGAACVLLGVLTQLWALLMAIEMSVAAFGVLWPQGHVPELELMLLAGSLTLVTLGDGPLSLAVGFKKRPA